MLVSGSRPAQMSAMTTWSAVASAAARSSSMAAARWKVSGSCATHTGRPGYRLAHGLDGGADGRGVVAVVVDDEDAPGLPLDLETPAHATEGRQAAGDVREAHAEERGRGGHAGRVGGVVLAGELKLDLEPGDRQVRGVPPGAGASHRAGSVGPSADRTASGRAADRTGTTRAPQSPRRRASSAPPASSVPMTTRRSLRARTTQPGLEGVHDGRPVSEDVRVVPLGVEDDGHVGSVGVEVAGVLVRLDDEGIPPPPARRGRRVRR